MSKIFQQVEIIFEIAQHLKKRSDELIILVIGQFTVALFTYTSIHSAIHVRVCLFAWVHYCVYGRMSVNLHAWLFVYVYG